MKKILSVISLLFLFASQHVSFAQSNDLLKIWTFNLRFATADDGDNSWQYRKDIMFDLLKSERPDIIGTQEGLHYQLAEITDQLGNYKFVGVGRNDGKTAGEFSAIIYDTTRFSIEGAETFWFSETPSAIASKSWGNEITRICTYALIDDMLTGKKFYIFNLHLDHISQNSRVKSIELLRKMIDEKTGGLPVTVTGDFNAEENNEAILLMNKSINDEIRFTDCFNKIHPGEKNRLTFNGFNGGTEGGKIDYIFCDDQFEIIDSKIIRYSRDGKYPSDHYPVEAVLRIK
ncbi:MAG: endonuclease/exonuclease/phosphatase family protein [Melioribacteraceae bacterium]|nr:endonuclease/exonuclease/phosphatase family protein [Melioribacteraceae bacterium]MCF8356573.1 endonuclease/exonuclease/phosphatase family protein [Melioribacteraceae bacterium]MCF8395988.1 endonuclease/exonuclease/phosphatase family protein [Melioribacteraceae bacterium]MCF8421039.1 endonuclease/exonuclease/phosphatase family protein [Melioribacteraceae bacterium]